MQSDQEDTKPEKRVKVPMHVFQAVVKVRDSGKTNMFDASKVAYLMQQGGDVDAALWVLQHVREYATGILSGMEPTGTNEEDE